MDVDILAQLHLDKLQLCICHDRMAASSRHCNHIACPIRLLQPINGGYKFDGPVVLVDGLTGPDTNYRTGRWLGFSQADLEEDTVDELLNILRAEFEDDDKSE